MAMSKSRISYNIRQDIDLESREILPNIFMLNAGACSDPSFKRPKTFTDFCENKPLFHKLSVKREYGTNFNVLFNAVSVDFC